MQIPNDFYTVATLFSLTGSATAVWIITGVIGYLLEPKDSKNLKKWIGLILSLVFALLGSTLVEERSPLIWVVAVVNGFLIYLAAVGANTVVARATTGDEAVQHTVRETSASSKEARSNFTEPWW